MAVLDLRGQIERLVMLQTIDSEIYALNNEKESKPHEIKALEDDFETKKQHLAELEKNLLDLQKQRKDQELELAVKEESAKKLQNQLYSLKTNKEYQTMLQQIEDAKADASIVEDSILEILDKSDKAKAVIEQEKQRLKEEEAKFNEKKKMVQERIKGIDERLAQLKVQRAKEVPEIDAKVLLQYERILQNRDGLAIAEVRNESCQGCNMSAPPQVVNLIRMYEHLVTCEVCNRILFIKE